MNKQDFQLWEMRARDSIDVKRCYVDVAGDLVGGILLSQIIYWHLPDEQGKTKLRVRHENHEWLAKKRDDWWEECRITPKQFDRALEVLEEKKLVVAKLFRFAGSPTKHIRLNWDGLFDALKSLVDGVFPKRSKSNLPKSTNPSVPNVKMDFDQTERTYTEITTEITTENTHTKSACEKLNLEKDGLSSNPSDLSSNKTKALEQVQNFASDQNSAALALPPNFASYIHPTQRCDDRFNRKLDPWQLSDAPNDYEPAFLKYLYTEHLPGNSFHKGKSLGRKDAENWINKRLSNQHEKANVYSMWSAYKETLQPPVANVETCLDEQLSLLCKPFSHLTRPDHEALIQKFLSLGEQQFCLWHRFAEGYLKNIKRYNKELFEELTGNVSTNT